MKLCGSDAACLDDIGRRQYPNPVLARLTFTGLSRPLWVRKRGALMSIKPIEKSGLNGSRTLALTTALVLHVGAVLLLVPQRPALQAQTLSAGAIEAIFVTPPPAPPPPPPPPPEVPPQPMPPRPIAMHHIPRPPPASVFSQPQPVQNTSIAPSESTDRFDPTPVAPPGPDQSAEVGAYADPGYGRANHLRYPTESLRKREHGALQLRVLIHADVSVGKVEIVLGSGSRRLDQAALQSVRAWRFVPARKNGETVASWAIVPITFNLDGR